MKKKDCQEKPIIENAEKKYKNLILSYIILSLHVPLWEAFGAVPLPLPEGLLPPRYAGLRQVCWSRRGLACRAVVTSSHS